MSRPQQEAALELLSSPAWERHLRTLSSELRDRCRTLVSALRTTVPEWTIGHVPTGGLHLWARLRAGADPAALAAAARQHGSTASR